jgi:3-hydroxyisobutyrate dehydrogenase-like beta-hydroxyacid dehydrogenase
MSADEHPAQPRRVGFIGLGTMGSPMAANLLRAGHRLAVHDARRAAATPLLDAGTAWADTPAAVAAASEVTFTSLPGPDEVEAVVAGEGGILAGAAPGSTIVDLSTNSPTVVRALAGQAAACGVGFLDAPVSGGAAGATRGTLTVMVGGDASLFDAVRPLLEVIGGQIFLVGDVGAGTVAKLVNNLLAIINMLSTVEALVLAGKAGIDLERLREVINSSSGRSAMWEYGSRLVLKDRLQPSFTVSLAAKDLALATRLANELGVMVPMGMHAEALLVGHRDAGFAREDVFATVKALEAQAGIVVRGAATRA